MGWNLTILVDKVGNPIAGQNLNVEELTNQESLNYIREDCISYFAFPSRIAATA